MFVHFSSHAAAGTGGEEIPGGGNGFCFTGERIGGAGDDVPTPLPLGEIACVLTLTPLVVEPRRLPGAEARARTDAGVIPVVIFVVPETAPSPTECKNNNQ